MNEWMNDHARASTCKATPVFGGLVWTNQNVRFLLTGFQPGCFRFYHVCSVNIKTPAKHRLWKLLGNCFLNRWSGPSHHSIRQMAAVRLTMDFFFPQSSYWNHLLCVYSTEAWHSGKTRCRWSGNWWWRFRLCSRETWLCSSWSVDTRSQCRAPISR